MDEVKLWIRLGAAMIIRGCRAAKGKAGLCLVLSLLATLLVPAMARADYTIGQSDVPQSVILADPAQVEVYTGRPRLFFRDTDLPTLRERLAGEFQPEWQRMLAYLESRVLAKPASTFAEGSFLKGWSPGRNVAFVAVVTGEKRFIEWAREWARTLTAAGPVGPDNHYRGRLQSLAVAYDWLHPWLSAEEKRAMEDALVAHIDRNWHFAANETNYIGGHSRWGNFALAAGLLAVVTERPELRPKLLKVRDHWVNGFFPAQGWIAQDGGYHMGWAYSAAYLTGGIHAVWSSATNECFFLPWQERTPLFWIYGRQGDGMYPNTGDAYTVRSDLNSERLLLMTSAGVFKNAHAAAIIRPNADAFAEILYGDKRVVPRLPDDAKEPLPLSRHFRNAGVVIARDRWDEATTHLQFRSTPFYSTNHHHRDENSFTLHYRAPLAIDSGLYDEEAGRRNSGGYGGPHWSNYFTRTIAHNAIVVFDPKQEMTLWGKRVSNDGGQPFRGEPATLADIQPGGNSHLGGIVEYRDTPEFTHAVGDATKAYDPDRVKLAQREIVYLRETDRKHPVIVVFDRVESASVEFEKKFLLHTVNEPQRKGALTVASHGGGRLTALTLLPREAEFEVIGGDGREAWVDGENHPWVPPSKSGSGIEPGAWRVEVAAPQTRLRDYFLHVFFVDDDDAPPVLSEEARLVSTAEHAEVNVGGWRLRFPFAPGNTATIERAGSDSSTRPSARTHVSENDHEEIAKSRFAERTSSLRDWPNGDRDISSSTVSSNAGARELVRKSMLIKLEPEELWWGGRVVDSNAMPYGAGAAGRFSLAPVEESNQSQPLLISNRGRFVWNELPFDFEFVDGALKLNGTESWVTGRAGDSLADAYREAARRFFPTAGRLPAAELFLHPQYNTWIELLYDQREERILTYARSLIAQGYPPGVLMIDDNWQEDYGVWEFSAGRIPSPKRLIQQLHELGFKVMLWVCPFVSPDSETYRELEKNGLLLGEAVVDASGRRIDDQVKPAIVRWWNGVSAVLDLSHPQARAWFKARLDRLVMEYGVDGFKLDAGDSGFYVPPPGRTFVSHEPRTPEEHTMDFVRVGLDYPLNEYRAGWKMAGLPLAQRLRDKMHTWEALQDLIPGVIAQGLMGYAFVCPDLIGGGHAGSFADASKFDPELVVRAAQVHALMPMMQFSVAPWRVLSAEQNQICLAAAKLHVSFGNEILALAREAAATGEPIVRPLAWAWPRGGYERVKDQFLLGARIMVAPVVEKGARSRTVVFPPGRWRGDDGIVITGPAQREVAAPLTRLPYFQLQP